MVYLLFCGRHKWTALSVWPLWIRIASPFNGSSNLLSSSHPQTRVASWFPSQPN